MTTSCRSLMFPPDYYSYCFRLTSRIICTKQSYIQSKLQSKAILFFLGMNTCTYSGVSMIQRARTKSCTRHYLVRYTVSPKAISRASPSLWPAHILCPGSGVQTPPGRLNLVLICSQDGCLTSWPSSAGVDESGICFQSRDLRGVPKKTRQLIRNVRAPTRRDH